MPRPITTIHLEARYEASAATAVGSADGHLLVSPVRNAQLGENPDDLLNDEDAACMAIGIAFHSVKFIQRNLLQFNKLSKFA